MSSIKGRSCGMTQLLAFAVLAPTLLGATPARAASVTVVIDNLNTTTGEIRCALFRSASGFPKDLKQAAQRVVGTITGQQGRCIFVDVPAGPVAVTALHDENNNNKLDLRFGLIPREGIGWSNNPKVTFAPPSFDQARVVVTDRPLALSIRLNQR